MVALQSLRKAGPRSYKTTRSRTRVPQSQMHPCTRETKLQQRAFGRRAQGSETLTPGFKPQKVKTEAEGKAMTFGNALLHRRRCRGE